MTLTTTVTARDKKLLVFLAVFILLAGVGLLVLKPALDEISELNTKITAAEATQRQIDYSISRIDEAEALLSESKQGMLDKTAELYPLMEAFEIDSLLTTEALRYGFEEEQLRELTIDKPEDFASLLPYLAPEETAAGNGATGYLTGIYAARASFTLTGTREQLEGFCDRLVNNYPAIRVSGFLWEQSVIDDTAFILTIECQIYMSDGGGEAAAPAGT